MNGVMQELVSAQERNEERYFELEQKRMKMDTDTMQLISSYMDVTEIVNYGLNMKH